MPGDPHVSSGVFHKFQDKLNKSPARQLFLYKNDSWGIYLLSLAIKMFSVPAVQPHRA